MAKSNNNFTEKSPKAQQTVDLQKLPADITAAKNATNRAKKAAEKFQNDLLLAKNAKNEMDLKIKQLSTHFNQTVENEIHSQKIATITDQATQTLTELLAAKTKANQQCTEFQIACSWLAGEIQKSSNHEMELLAIDNRLTKKEKEIALVANKIKLLKPNLKLFKGIAPVGMYSCNFQLAPVGYRPNFNNNSSQKPKRTIPAVPVFSEQDAKQEKSGKVTSRKRKSEEADVKEDSEKRRKIDNNSVTMAVAPALPEEFPDGTFHATLLDWNLKPEALDKILKEYQVKGELETIINKELNGWTPIQMLILNGPPELVKTLLNYKPNLNVTYNGWNLVQLFAKSEEMNKPGSEEVLKMLFDSQLFSINEGSALMPLHIAVNFGNDQTVMNLIKMGSDVNQIDLEGLAPLHYAACKDANLPVLKILLNTNGIKINRKSLNKWTPLHFAADFCAAAAAQALIDAKCELNIKNNQHLTPLDYAFKPTANGNKVAKANGFLRNQLVKDLSNLGCEVSFYLSKKK